MESTALRHILIALVCLLWTLCVSAQDRTTTKNNKPGIYDNLYDIYLEASKNRSNEKCIHLSDSMRTLATLQKDKRAVALSWANPLSYYMSQDDEENIFLTAKKLMDSSEEVGLWSMYYHALAQQSIYLLRHVKVGEALNLAEHTMEKAYADNNPNGIYASHTMFVNCYIILGLFDKGIEEARKAIDAEYTMPDANFGNGVIKLMELYYRLHDWQSIIDIIAEYEDKVEINSTLVRLSEYEAISRFWLSDKKGYRDALRKLEERKAKYGHSTQGGLRIALDGIRLMEEGKMDEAEKLFRDRLGNPDKYFYLFECYKRTKDVRKMEEVYFDNVSYLQKQKSLLYDTDIKKYELELDNRSLELENRELAFQRNRTRAGLGIAVLVVLLLSGLLLYLNSRRHNRRLKEANETLQRQKKQLEDNITAIQKANSENEAKTSFLFNMSHDIRTPMNAIIGFRDMLEKYQDDPLKRADYLQKIKDSSKVLLSIINNVLEMSRIEKGTVELHEEPCNAEQFYDSLYVSFGDLMLQKGIEFTRRIDIRHPGMSCDVTKLREIFNNILSNAYKYTLPGGKVFLCLEELPSEEPDVVLLRTTVSDTSIGMSEEFLPRLFEEFSRENNTTDVKIEGTGLGMPIVKRLVEIMKGTIEVSSRKGEGTTFIVTIPHGIAELPEVAGDEEVRVNPELFAGKRVLLAEDNDLNAEIAAYILGESGIEADRAEDGLHAVEMVKNAPDGYYAMVLMDVQMPNMNGYEATRAIRSLPDARKASIPIVAMTANAFEEDKRDALEAGMNGHLSKPFEIEELYKIISKFIS